MRNLALALALGAVALSGCTKVEDDTQAAIGAANDTERNKEIARKFYEDLWFSNNTATYADYVADEYVVHDIGERKNVTEKAIEQKQVADLFHEMADATGEIDYQIAEGDKVATRWFWTAKANDTGKSRGFSDVERLPVINVFRFNDDGKIVEIWNHRHDIDMPQRQQPGDHPPDPGMEANDG